MNFLQSNSEHLPPSGTGQRNIFDVDEQNEDIMKAAAQREQQRGAGRHIRGTMGPVTGKEVRCEFFPAVYVDRYFVQKLATYSHLCGLDYGFPFELELIDVQNKFDYFI